MHTIQFKITNLHCEACVKLSTVALQQIPGVKKVEINLKDGDVQIETERSISCEEIEKSLQKFEKTMDRKSYMEII